MIIAFTMCTFWIKLQYLKFCPKRHTYITISAANCILKARQHFGAARRSHFWLSYNVGLGNGFGRWAKCSSAHWYYSSGFRSMQLVSQFIVYFRSHSLPNSEIDPVAVNAWLKEFSRESPLLLGDFTHTLAQFDIKIILPYYWSFMWTTGMPCEKIYSWRFDR